MFPVPLLLALVAAVAPGGARATDLDLEVRHKIVSLGGDGVTRTSEFRERMLRRADLVWVERILPEGAPEAREHDGGTKEHEHVDLSAAARWISKEPGGGLRLRLVLAHDRLVLEVPPADRPSVGFDGDWESASRLIGSKALQAMKPSARGAPTGTRWYESQGAAGWVRVLWDERELYPRRVESGNAAGTVRKWMVAEKTRPSPAPPWTRLEGYAMKEYADTLD